MTEKVVYLDSSAIVKRYVHEIGSEFIRAQYHGAYHGNLLLSFSVWSIREVIGVFDRAHKQKKLHLNSWMRQLVDSRMKLQGLRK